MSNEKLDKDETVLGFLWRTGRTAAMGPIDFTVGMISAEPLKQWWTTTVPIEGIIEDLFKHHPFSNAQIETLKLLARKELIELTYEDFEAVRRDYYKHKNRKIVSKVKDTTSDATNKLIRDLSAPVVSGDQKFFRHELEEEEEFFLSDRFDHPKAATTIKENIGQVKDALVLHVTDKIFDDPLFREFLSKKYKKINQTYSAFEQAPDAGVRNRARAEILECVEDEEVLKVSVDYFMNGKAVYRFGVKLLSAVTKKNYRVWEYVNKKEIKQTFSAELTDYPTVDLLYSKGNGFERLEGTGTELSPYMRTIRAIDHMVAKNSDMALRLWIRFFNHALFKYGSKFWTTFQKVQDQLAKEGKAECLGDPEVEFDTMMFGAYSEIGAYVDPAEKLKKETAIFNVEKGRQELKKQEKEELVKVEESEEKIAKARLNVASSKKSQQQSEAETAKFVIDKARAGDIQNATIDKDIATSVEAKAKSDAEKAKSEAETAKFVIDKARATEVQNATIDKDIAASVAAKAKSDAEKTKSEAEAAKALVQGKRADELVTADIQKNTAIVDLSEQVSDAGKIRVLGLINGTRGRSAASANNLVPMSPQTLKAV